MSKPITAEQTKAFSEFCERMLIAAGEVGETAAYFTLESYDAFGEEDEDGDQMWEFGAANYEPKNHDIYDLFASVPFTFEEEGYGSFYVGRN